MTSVDPRLLSGAPSEPFDQADALQIFTALAQPGRLAVFLEVVSAGQAGCSAHDLVEALPMNRSAVTVHLRTLGAVGMVAARIRPRGAGSPRFVAHIDRYVALGVWLERRFRDAGWALEEMAKPPASSPMATRSARPLAGR